MRLSLAGARVLHLVAQGLHAAPEAPARKEDVLAAIRRMAGLQIDSISVVARSPYLVLWSRLGAYEPRWLDELLAEGALFEYWSRSACFLPIEAYPLYRRRMLERGGADPFLNGGSPERREAIGRVLAQIRERGPVRAADFERTDGRRGVWWDWKPEKQALEHLFNAGVLMIARRERFQRVYDLRERVLPDWDDARTPPTEEVCRALLLQAVRALGVAPARLALAYLPIAMPRGGRGLPSDPITMRGRTAQRAAGTLLEELAGEGEVIRVEVEGWNEPAYLHREHRELADQAASGALQAARTTLLSPFDPVTCDRNRARELFGFNYRIETYTPAEQRRYGYFTLPILHRDRLVGRLDPKAHRREGVFEVRALHLEPDVPLADELVAALAAALRECAVWHGTPQVAVRRSEPPELAAALTAELLSQRRLVKMRV
jgi:uncharacterized protein